MTDFFRKKKAVLRGLSELFGMILYLVFLDSLPSGAPCTRYCPLIMLRRGSDTLRELIIISGQ